jgi:HK97 gp10 family phage protein
MRVVIAPDALAHIDAAAEKALIHLAHDIVNDAQRYAPRKTGRLISGISALIPSNLRVKIVSSAPYSRYVELGTRFHRAHPFLRRALYQKRQVH